MVSQAFIPTEIQRSAGQHDVRRSVESEAEERRKADVDGGEVGVEGCALRRLRGSQRFGRREQGSLAAVLVLVDERMKGEGQREGESRAAVEWVLDVSLGGTLTRRCLG